MIKGIHCDEWTTRHGAGLGAGRPAVRGRLAQDLTIRRVTLVLPDDNVLIGSVLATSSTGDNFKIAAVAYMTKSKRMSYFPPRLRSRTVLLSNVKFPF